MTKISKKEAELIRNKFPKAHIRVVGKFAPARKKSRYVEDSKYVLNFLIEIRQREGLI